MINKPIIEPKQKHWTVLEAIKAIKIVAEWWIEFDFNFRTPSSTSLASVPDSLDEDIEKGLPDDVTQDATTNDVTEPKSEDNLVAKSDGDDVTQNSEIEDEKKPEPEKKKEDSDEESEEEDSDDE